MRICIRRFRFRRVLQVIALVTAAVGAAATASGQTSTLDALDRKVAPTPVAVSLKGALRAQTTRVLPAFRGTSFAASLSAKSAFDLALFNDLALSVQRTRLVKRAGGVITWIGTVKGQPSSSALFVASESSFSGNVQVGSRLYLIRGRSDGSVTTTEIDTSKLPIEAEPQFRGKLPFLETICRPKIPAAVPTTTNVDVMVAYTAAAQGDVPPGSTIETEIELAIEDANAAYEASGINLHLTAVGPNQRYVDAETSFEADVERLKGKNDGHFDDIHTLRDQHHADIVALMVHNGQYCGIASAIQDVVSTSFADRAFTVVNLGCAAGNHSFAHELGHLMGAHHDTGVDGSGASYAHGYIDFAHGFRTIMAYRNACDAQNKACPRIGLFSGPNVSYQGYVAGSANTDNVRRLNETALTVSRFRLNSDDEQVDNVSAQPNICTLAKKPLIPVKPELVPPVTKPGNAGKVVAPKQKAVVK